MHGKDSLTVKLRLPAVAAAALLAAALLAPSAFATSNTVVIAQLQVHGPSGGNDEFIQLKNVSATAQSIGGWQVWGANSAGTASSRVSVPAGVSLPAGASYLFTNTAANGYSGAVPGDTTYATGITDTGGVQLRNAAGQVIDAAGHTALSGTAAPYKEGGGLAFPTTGPNWTFLRKNSGTQDTDDNAADFDGPQTAGPANCGAPCAVADPCSTSTITPISDIQTLGPSSPLNLQTVKIRGIVTGVDDLYGSNFDSVFKADAGIWVQQATHDPSHTTSEALFVSSIKRPAGDPAADVGADITICGKIFTQFGLVELVPQGGDSPTTPDAKQFDLDQAATVTSRNNPLPAPIDIDPGLAASQDAASRPYYRSLQGMRVRLAAGIATGGGTTKFRDVYVRPGAGPFSRLFRKNNSAAITSPWSDAPDELGIAADGGAHNPADPRLPWRSGTQVDLDLFDGVQNVVGPLTFAFNFYEVMPQLNGPTPTIIRGPINAAYPPAAPAQPPSTLRYASFNVENYFPVGKVNDGHTITQPEYDARTDAIVKAIRSFLKEPDVIAMQEVAVFADGANALTGLAQALGNYTGYITTNNDGRGIATGFLIKNGVTAANGRLLDADKVWTVDEKDDCDLATGNAANPGKVYDRAPYALDISKGDIAATVISNHFASQGHENYCRIREADLLRQQAAAMVAAGKNVITSGDLNDFEFSDALAQLTQGGTLTNLWSKAPQGLAYSYKFQGHLQTLDHILVSPGLTSRVTDMRYMHFDNDYYERAVPDGTGISDHDPPLATFQLSGTGVNGDVTGSVPATLSLSLSGTVNLGSFTPGVGKDYDGNTVATVTSSAETADLSVMDASSNATGRLVNGTRSLASPLQLNAGGPFAPVHADGTPLLLKHYGDVASNDATTINVRQHIDTNEGLRTGTYGKTLTFTLSTTQP
jgi:predicted extracellular nuclease